MKDAPACPYAPRHRPDDSGRCTWCMAEVPAPWFMRRQPDPEQTVMAVVARAGGYINPQLAREITEAVLAFADHAYKVSLQVYRQEWEDEPTRERLRERLRRQLLAEVVAQGMLPVALPSEALRYLAHLPVMPGGQDGEVPAPMAEADANWEMVEVTLAVACRTPVMDDRASVRTGVL